MPLPGRRRSDQNCHDSVALRVLIVDDDADTRVYIAALLKRLGFDVTQAIDGAQAAAEIDQRAFDLLIIDYEMPRMSGITLIAHVRASEHCCEAYALMLTAREDIETKIAALRLGFDDFLVKSMSDVELVAKFGATRRLITRQRRLDATVRELYGLATRDELTGLFNRRFFYNEAERRLSDDAAIGVVLFDLDDFKQINDHFGHLAGDRVLRDVGALFLRSTRHEDLIARYGGDEFVMLVASAIPEEIERVAARLARQISQLQWTVGTETFHTAATIGYATSALLTETRVDQLLDACDHDLYKNKWMRTHPDRDPSLYEYDHSRSGRLFDLVDFPAAAEDADTTIPLHATNRRPRAHDD
jgi:diguanylate cyclase (GGDEF)-like protein